MTALAAARITKSKGGTPRRQVYLVDGGSVIYAGALVCINASGYAVPAAATAGFSDVVGIALADVDNTDGSDGDTAVVVEYGIAFLLDVGGGITQADVGRDAFVVDDQTVTDAGAATGGVRAGKILEYLNEAQDKAWVNVDNAASSRDASIGAAQLALFVSTEQTGTGSSQNVAHGLGATPSKVLIVPTEHPGTPDTGAFDIAEGAHDVTNVVVTVTVNVKFKVWALA
jgi:hypothetical protein